MVRWCLVTFSAEVSYLIWTIVGQGPIVLAVVSGGYCLDIWGWSGGAMVLG